MGVPVESSKVNQAASTLGCQILRTPFKYLGTKVGGTMHRAIAWQEVADPTKVKNRERESAEGEARLLDSIIAHVVSLLPVVPACADSELEASVKRIIFEENVAVEKPKRLRKKRQAAADTGSSSYPPKKLRSAYGTLSGVVHIGKSPSALKDLLASSILNSGVPAAFVTRPNLHPIGSPERFVISLDYSHHSSTNTSGAEGDSIIRPAVVPPVVTEAVITTHISSIPFVPASKPSNNVITLVHASMFHDSESTGTMRPDVAGSSHVPGKDLSMGSQEIDSESLHDVFVPRWNIPNNTLLDSLDASREFIDHLAPQFYLRKFMTWIMRSCSQSLALGSPVKLA
nr:RNA-directed DNA polymerase, eukaryota [Tanacetum cinerariifolium]